MSGWRMFIGTAILAVLVAVAVFIWIDRMAPVAVVVEPAPTEMMRVSISGAIATPGVVSVPPGARVAEVADSAGGFTDDADLSALNLAGRVGDGEHIVVPSNAPTTSIANRDGMSSVRTSSDGQGPLNVNIATVQELDQLPGIGEVLADRIVEYREQNGAFTSVDELVHVEGISSRMVDELRPLVTVDPDG